MYYDKEIERNIQKGRNFWFICTISKILNEYRKSSEAKRKQKETDYLKKILYVRDYKFY